MFQILGNSEIFFVKINSFFRNYKIKYEKNFLIDIKTATPMCQGAQY